MKAESVLLAQKYDEKKHGVAGWYLSEKIDGMRAWWDGGVTRGMLSKYVPWANVEKDARYIEPVKSTGLWSRYNKPIQAPDWWLDQLPLHMLDGELWIGNGKFQELMSTVKTLRPGIGWRNVRYYVFDVPALMFMDRTIDTTNFKKHFHGFHRWYLEKLKTPQKLFQNFETMYRTLEKEFIVNNDVVVLHKQERLPFHTVAAKEKISEELEKVSVAGGEGLMVRKPESIWLPERSWNLLKIKKLHDAEGVVVGYTAGKETELGSKLLGLMGSLRVRFRNVEFDLSGFTDEEREMVFIDSGRSAEDDLSQIPGGVVPLGKIHNARFPIGVTISFKYRELSDDGKPREAKYWRKS